MEYFDICNESGIPTGKTVSREQAHAEGILHRTAHIWVVRKVDDAIHVLLQKRALGKDSFPGCYDTSSAGHIQAGDEPLESALRELEEELGICAKPEELTFLGTFRIQYEKEFYGKLFKDNEVAFTYIYQEAIDLENLTLQEEEVESVKWFGADTTYLAVLEKDPEFCLPPGGLDLVRSHFYPHCSNPVFLKAKTEIDQFLSKYGSDCQIAFLRKIAIITNSYRVNSKEDRLTVCKMIKDTGITNRSVEDLSAEWQFHNVAYDVNLSRRHTKDVDLDYDQDPRFAVRFATKVFKTLHLE